VRFLFPPEDQPLDQSWWRPLEQVAQSVAGRPRYRFFDLSDFMMMCGINRAPRPRLILYKHSYTRRYLNLDDAGLAYRYIAPRETSSGSGRYLVHRTMEEALEALALWELPWMKPELEAHTGGLSWEDRWMLRPDRGDDGCDVGGGAHGHLRLV